MAGYLLKAVLSRVMCEKSTFRKCLLNWKIILGMKFSLVASNGILFSVSTGLKTVPFYMCVHNIKS